MSTSMKDNTAILKEALHLRPDERIQLVEDIWDSIAAEPEVLPLTEAQKKELDRRLERVRRNPDAGSPWSEVRKRLGKRK
jgi:putative addiction module component (TIGR02574 family)